MSRAILGIDPGLHGGLAILHSPTQVVCCPTPIIKNARRTPRSSKGGLDAYDLPGMLQLLMGIKQTMPVHAYLEAVGARPGQGRSSMLMIGRGSGYWEMALTAAQISYELVQPGHWKRQAGLLKQPKNAVIPKLQQWLPNIDWRNQPDGCCDAAAMAFITGWGATLAPTYRPLTSTAV